MKGTLPKLIIALVIAGALVYILLQNQGVGYQEKVSYVDVVVMKVNVLANERIEMDSIAYKSVPVDIAEGYVKSKEEVANKFAKNNIYEGELLNKNKVKEVADVIPTADQRQIRIVTNIAAYAGVGKGDLVDLIYVDKIGALNTVGKVMFQGLEVQDVLNKHGKDLETVQSDKYNQAENEPGYVTFLVSLEQALEMQTLQGTSNEVVFSLVRWTDYSEKNSEELPVKTQEQVIFNRTGVIPTGPLGDQTQINTNLDPQNPVKEVNKDGE